MSSDIRVKVDDREVRRLMRNTPRVFNSEFNRSFSRIGGAFYRKFAKDRLRKGGIQVRRKISRRRTARGGITVPVKARALGFSGILVGRDRLDDKQAIMRSGSPVAKIHESGGTITPKKGRHLFIRVRSVAAARRAGVQIPRGKKPAVLRVSRVVIKPRLGFHRTWNSFQPEARRRLGESLNRAASRAIRSAKRGA